MASISATTSSSANSTSSGAAPMEIQSASAPWLAAFRRIEELTLRGERPLAIVPAIRVVVEEMGGNGIITAAGIQQMMRTFQSTGRVEAPGAQAAAAEQEQKMDVDEKKDPN